MEFEQILTLIQAVSDSELTDFVYQNEDQKINLKLKKKKETMVVAAQGAENMCVSPMPVMDAPAAKQADASDSLEGKQVISSPLVGTFYSAASPDQEPFVKVGDTVKKGQIIGIVEAMKLMNEIESDFDGVVKEILVENEQVVEYGQPMIVIG